MDLIDSDFESMHKYDDILYENYNVLPVVNVRTLFEDNFEMDVYKKTIDNLSSGNYVTADINNNRLFVSLPKYRDDNNG